MDWLTGQIIGMYVILHYVTYKILAVICTGIYIYVCIRVFIYTYIHCVYKDLEILEIFYCKSEYNVWI